MTPRLNRLSWSLPRQITGCEYTGFEMDFQRPHDSGTLVQVGDSTRVYLHGSEDTCFGAACYPLTEADSVVSYKIRTMASGTNVPGPWSATRTVRRSTTYRTTVPLGFSMIHQKSGHVKLYWNPPVFPSDTTAVITYDIQHRAGSGSWRSLPSVSGDTARVSFADLTPVGVSRAHKFRIRTVHGRSRSAWVEAAGELVTFDAPDPFSVQMFDRNAEEYRLTIEALTEADRKRYSSLSYVWEISEDNRRTYTEDERGTVSCGHIRCIKFQKDSTTVDLTYWVKIQAWHGTISGATYDIDFTMNSDSVVTSGSSYRRPPNEDTFRTPTRCIDPTHSIPADICDPPSAPDSEATYGPGYLTVAWTTTQREGYSPGTNPDGSNARITRVEMRYEACPLQWSGWRKRMERIGPALGQSGTYCRSGSRKSNGSRGSITYRPSFSDKGGQAVDVWQVTTFAKAVNSRGKSSGEEINGGHVTR